ncbi:MAG: type I polyketide synthase [Candidatus Omnitrophota bacterium]
MNKFERNVAADSQRILNALDEAASKLEASEKARSEPIAIIGLGCRFPGGANNLDSFWRLLLDGRDAVTDIPPDRWDVDACFDPVHGIPGKMVARCGAFLEDVSGFDAAFFGVSPREAAAMDPQQRILLETAWEALENAGIVRRCLTGSATGVFIGITNNDYSRLLVRSGDLAYIDAYFGSGNALNAAAGRLSFLLGLQGPSLAVDTACSSSLAAIHLACQSLRLRECDLAISGGVNLVLAPEASIALSQARMLSPDGRCKTFDAAADGYGRGEGCGAAILKRLSDAQADGDEILALIRGSAVNQDGPSGGFTVPNGPAQQALIRRALANAKLKPADIDYIEAHGTGTVLGDPIEVKALVEVFREGRSPQRPLQVGSVKTNIGHLESAAGIAGFIKAVLCLRHGTIPPHLHFRQPNPHIPWDEIPISIPATNIPWPSTPGKRFAGVSSFGASGTNAHVILQDAPPPKTAAPVSDRPLHLLALSAMTDEALRQLAGRYEKHLTLHSDLIFGDVCYSANTGRTPFPHRLCVLAESSMAAKEKLSHFAKQNETSGVISGQVNPAAHPKIAFLFTGQGSQYLGMGRGLYETQSFFRMALEKCDEILRPLLPRPLLDVLFNEDGKNDLDKTAYTQPALFALEYALADLWKSWGITPSAVFGHSVGEYAAACLAGVFNLEEGLRLIAHRACLMQSLPQDGEMAAIKANEDLIKKAIQPFVPEVAIAAINGPESVVVSGKRDVVNRILSSLKEQGINGQRLNVSHAFHSPLMESILPEFKHIASSIIYSKPRLPIISNLTGELADEAIAAPEYWVNHIRHPVRFAAGMEALQRRGCTIFIEIGPNPVLLGMGRQCLPENAGTWLPSLRRGGDDWRRMLESAAELWIRGVDIDWGGFDRDYLRRRVSLPTYPWQHKKYWAVETNRTPSAPNSTTEKAPTLILHLLQNGETESLARQLEEANDFSREEKQCLPKLLHALVQQHQKQLAAASIMDWFYKPTWRPCSRRVSQLLDYLPAPQDLQPVLISQLEQMAAAPELNSYWEGLNRLESLSVDYVIHAFHQLGWRFEVCQVFTVDVLVREWGVVEGYRRLLHRLLEILEEEKILRRVESGWELISALENCDPHKINLEYVKQYLQTETEWTLLDRCGGKLAETMRGECDPLQLLFPEDDSISAARLYQDVPGAQIMNRLVGDAATRSLQNLPPNRMARILEIGAGTGGTTSYILPHLPDGRVEYVFTDISPYFLDRAREKFRAYSYLIYRVLDIERDPQSQGFEANQYDLIVAANVLHAVQDLRQALAYVRNLLAPGGMLILLEGTAPIRFIDLIFGLTDGWRRFADTALRPAHPLISPSQWQEILLSSGFSQVSPIVLSPEKGGLLSRQAVIAAQADKPAMQETKRKKWLIFSDKQGVGAELKRLLQSNRNDGFLVYPGAAFKKTAEGDYSIHPGESSDYRRLFNNATTFAPLDGVVFLWGLDAAKADSLSVENLSAASQLICGGVLLLIQSIIKAGFAKPPSLWLASQGAVSAIDQDDLSGLAQSTLWGMGKIAALEHSELQPVCIDLEPALPQKCARIIYDEITWSDSEDQIAYRSGVRYAARLERVQPDELFLFKQKKFHEDAAYLITGGLGGLGLLTARWMISQGARHIFLIGRSAPSEDAIASIREMERLGADIAVIQADISIYSEAKRAMAQIGAAGRPLCGVVHAAGVLDDGVLLHLDWPRFESVLRPKVQGAWNLHRLTREHPLDFFVLYSSAASLLGSSGQANHAAANAFLDALAPYRRAQGWPGTSVNWGPWDAVGAAARRGVGNRLKIKGVGTLSPQRGEQTLPFLFANSPPQLGVVPVDWAQIAEPAASQPFLADLRPAVLLKEEKKADFWDDFLKTPANKRRPLLITHIRNHIAKVLGWDSKEPLDSRQGFFEMGMDSLTAMELRHRLQTTLRRTLPATAIFNYPTVESLTDYLLDLDRIPAAPVAQREDKAEKKTLNNIDQLSINEIGALIDEELKGIENKRWE